MSNVELRKIFYAIFVLTAGMSNVNASECAVVAFESHDNQRTNVNAGIGTIIPGTDTATVPITTISQTERCAQIRIQCDGNGSSVIESDELTAHFADGKQKRAMKGGFENFRLDAGESRDVYTCFGSSDAPILSIEGRFL